ncbi:MAG: bifunctional 5,10-methylene-tetrahydrofolate dehydrogenase/5,10-methylene-tetrahydrofolate cyclohydrolase [Rickettsiales bacterium]|nr:bifunctional 5,10-methylene-tetrahydrofolate dehydrogenase/5,10-methylene-tetrahydrofolate cyclohydrolase [Rickettsiales bacterium]|tara:strand:+ start:23500 stop:24345 length:846 start_codon:yes stop_codon:yes gene_type:complete
MSLLLDGKALLQKVKTDLKQKVSNLPRPPHVVVFLIGDNPGSHLYVKSKRQHAQDVGIELSIRSYEKAPTHADLAQQIQQLNQDPAVDGIFIQLPLPKPLNALSLINTITPSKDVDGLTATNLGTLFQSPEAEDYLKPCTPQGCMQLIHQWQKNLSGLNAVIIGRSLLVGKPIVQLLLTEGCTTIQAHSQTKNLTDLCQTADIIVSATGQPGLITESYIKPGACIIDVGIASVNGKTTGDVAYTPSLINKVAAYSPVPGGVGPTTIANLLTNSLKAYYLNQ